MSTDTVAGLPQIIICPPRQRRACPTTDVLRALPPTRGAIPLSCCSSSSKNVVINMTKPKVAVVYYSLYGHVRMLALEEKRGLEEVGCDVTLRKQ